MKVLSLYIIVLIFIAGCVNPFAPRLEENPVEKSNLADQTTIDGVFQNFRYAYLYKDTLVYGKLLHNDFVFVYVNYNEGAGTTKSWGRNEDMLTTKRLFDAALRLDLNWDNTLAPEGDSLLQRVSRGFSLYIIFDPVNDRFTINGRARFVLKRDSVGKGWKILSWNDESEF